MTTDKFAAERVAYQGLAELFSQADRCKELFVQAGLPLPEPLRRILGMTEQQAKHSQRIEIPAPSHPRPPEAENDWVSVQLRHATPTSVALAVLQRDGTVRAKDVAARVMDLLPEASGGSVANIGSRLSSLGVIRRDAGEWKLVNRDSTPILYQGRLWGPQKVFGKTELASHRREAILEVLAAFKGGLQVLQILERLKTCGWVHAPLNKDLLKDDVNALSDDKKIRRRGNTRKWELAQEKDSSE